MSVRNTCLERLISEGCHYTEAEDSISAKSRKLSQIVLARPECHCCDRKSYGKNVLLRNKPPDTMKLLLPL